MGLHAPDDPFFTKLKKGSIKVMKGAYNVVDFFFKFYAIFKALGIPIEGWLALTQYMSNTDFETVVDFFERLPIWRFTGTTLKQMFVKSVRPVAKAIDWFDLGPGTKAGVTLGLGTLLRYTPSIVQAMIVTIAAYLGYRRVADVPRLA